MCQLFVSSDIDNVPAGIKWLERISDELDKANLFLVLVSPDSITRPWINFETGCAWEKHVPVIPICHSGLSVASLPRPLSDFQALGIESDEFISSLFKSIATYLDITVLPKIDVNSFRLEINKALKTIENSAGKTVDVSDSGDTITKLDEAFVKILRIFSESSDQSSSVLQTSRKLGLSEIKTQVYFDELAKLGFISKSETLDSESTIRYYLTARGRKWLFSEHLI
jgi:hypothetical protein